MKLGCTTLATEARMSIRLHCLDGQVLSAYLATTSCTADKLAILGLEACLSQTAWQDRSPRPSPTKRLIGWKCTQLYTLPRHKAAQ